MDRFKHDSRPCWRAAIAVAIVLSAAAVLRCWPGVEFVATAHAAQLVTTPEDPAVAARVKNLESELRCLVCQAQSVAESDSDFSHDIRREVNRMVVAGSSDAEIKEFLVERYGDFILFKPPVKSTTMLLWAGPMILLLIGVGALIMALLRRRRTGAMPLSDQDHRRAEALLATGDGKGKIDE